MILLPEWIRRTIDEVDRRTLASFGGAPSPLRKSLVLCSDEYLLSAIRVSLSLANSICKAEEQEDGGNWLSLMPSSNWSDFIAVNTPKRKNDGVLTDNEDVEHKSCVEVTLLPSQYSANDVDQSCANMTLQRIHSLGLVLYEIFSGGERPKELMNGAQNLDMVSNDLLVQENINYDPLPFDDEVPTDLNLDFSEVDTLLKELNTDENQCLPPNKRQSQQQQQINSVSLEPLKSKWIPQPLCDLIANMLDSTNGILAGEDSYESMRDVRDDLQLMLEKPGIYLYDQDMGEFSVAGLQLGDTMFGRNEELSSLKNAYHQSISGDNGELIIISGPSGSGKSLLADKFGKFVSAGGGIVLSGKFDQLQQGRPFSALSSAFDIYCGNLLKDKSSSSTVSVLASKLLSSLGGEAYYLTKMIPNLALLLGPGIFDVANHDQVCDHPQERLQYLLCQFVGLICFVEGAPVTLFLDDLQWADPASIAAVSQLLFTADFFPLSSRRCKQFFFFGCCREGALDEDHPFWKLFFRAKLIDMKYTNIKLTYFEEDVLNAMVSESLHLSPRLTRCLSKTLHQKTKGNAFFVVQMLLCLSKEGLLRPSLSRRRWEWNLDKIQSQNLPDDIAIFISNSIEALSADVKFSIRVMSCFGASVERSVIKKLEMALQMKLVDNLDEAVREGLLYKKDNQYRFSHDRIQEAAYNMIDGLERCLLHFRYGMALAPLETEEHDDSNLLIAANQLNLAGPEAVQDKSLCTVIANLNLRAGKKAMEMSDFVSAYSYFDQGITFLRKKHWMNHYALSLELFDLAAKCALTNGDIENMTLLCEQVRARGISFEDKLNVMYFNMCSLAFSSRLSESIDMGLDILLKLGIEVNGHGSSVEDCVQQTRRYLSSYTDDGILKHQRMTDPTAIMAMKFLGKLEVGMSQIMPNSVVSVARRIIQLSLIHGLSPVSPIGFVHFGSHMAKLGDIREGYRYVKLALKLVNRVGSRESAGEVICFAAPVIGYVEPLQATLEYHDKGYAAAMAYGDILAAATNNLGLCISSFFSGSKLQSLRERFVECVNFTRERKLLILMVQLQQAQHSIFKLIGTNEEPEYNSEGRNIIATNNSVMTSVYFHKAFICFMFRLYDELEENTQKYLACIDNTWGNLFVAHSFHAFYVGVISFWCSRQTEDNSSRKHWLERGIMSKLALKKWAESSVWTFEDMWLLLEAEESFCNKDFDSAKKYYDMAISSAKEHKFIMKEALGYELAAYFHLQLGQRDEAVEKFLQAHEKYNEWGAFGKCTSLFQFVTSKVTLLANTNSRQVMNECNGGVMNSNHSAFTIPQI